MSKLPRYESYKDSGVQWLGEIPSHWEVWKITHAMDLIGSGTTPKSDNLEYYDGDVLWVTTSELRESYIYDTKQKVTDSAIQDYSALKKYPINSIAIAMYGATIGRLGILAREATFNQACCVFSGSKVLNHKFLYYWLWMRRPILISLSNGGGQPNLSQDDLKKLKLALPPIDEQKIIADFLDKRLTQVDALIAKQETLLEKLAEQRVALISHAVTKGLNPDADFIISKNAWLGEIPKDWILKPTKYFLSYVGSGKTPKGGAEVYIDEGVIMIRSQNIHDEGLRLEDVVHITDEADQGQINTRVYEDDVLLNITGASLGRVSLVPKGIPLANVNQHVCILRPIKSLILPQFLHLIMQSHYAKSLIKSEENGTSREGLTFEQIKAMVFALPPIDEQQTICEKIQSDLDDLNKSKNYCENLIKKLKEYRSTVITQVVTGKIDVRNLKVN
ncbi:restriction endonuclease subunit S [Acinetobacter baumannii]|nr:restriction endonuclease subunit S [Acinetobacter baumannii]